MAKERKKWTIEAIKADALKYQTRWDWQTKSSKAYGAAKRRDILDECCGHMTELCHKWTIRGLIQEALLYQTRSEFAKHSTSAYNIASRDRILDKICQHMHEGCHRWTIPEITDEAMKYQSRSEFVLSAPKPYAAARKLNILDQVCSHMVTPVNKGTDSVGERDVLAYIQQYYPKAQKTTFGKRKYREWGNCFELDIYIPELRKGIEFNGKYWHSIEGLRRGRSGCPDIILENYHDLKTSFFLQRGIVILYIDEISWRKSPDKEIKRIQAFLSSTNDSI